MLSRKATVKQGSIHSQDGAIWDREAAQWLRGYTALAIQSPASGSGGSQPLETLVPGFQCLRSPRPAVSTCIPNTHNLKKWNNWEKKTEWEAPSKSKRSPRTTSSNGLVVERQLFLLTPCTVFKGTQWKSIVNIKIINNNIYF